MTDLDDDPMRQEYNAWKLLPFVDHGEKGKNNWAVPRFSKTTDDEDEKVKVCIWESILGEMFAIDLLAHFTDHPDIMPSRLGDVVRDMVKGGTWGLVEIGFFGAVDQFIGTGEVSMGAWTAHPKKRLAESVEVNG